jgi:tRNA modification GTPase
MTIFAPATPQGRSAVAVIRVSGPRAGQALTALAGTLPKPRSAALRTLRDPLDGARLDQALVLWFPAPASETGEDMAEFQIHGSRAVLAAVQAALARLPGLRPAEPGEFTRRAFANGKLDLTAVEGLADLVAAETEAQRRQAQRQYAGELGRLIEGWREDLIRSMSRLEAAIDFPDEDLPKGVLEHVRVEVEGLRRTIRGHLDDGRRGERLREGFHVAILGAPNVGKSSLLNRLAGRDAAIVAPEAGTTRDIIEVHLDLGGLPVTIADTAGLRETASAIEAEGMRRALERAEDADLKILIGDSERMGNPGLDLGPASEARTIRTINKVDLRRPEAPLPVETHLISCRTGEGIDGLVAAITERLMADAWSAGAPPLTRPRHRAELTATAEALGRALSASGPELMAEDLRLAARALGRVTGRVDVEDLLDRIFAEFCVGK